MQIGDISTSFDAAAAGDLGLKWEDIVNTAAVAPAAAQWTQVIDYGQYNLPTAGPRSWECHRCRAVNAPHVNQCSCRAGASSGTGTIVPTDPNIAPGQGPGWLGEPPYIVTG